MGLFSNHGGKISERWVFDAKAQLISAAAVAMLHGSPHIILGTKGGKIICLDEKGQEDWSFQAKESLSNTEEFFIDQERVHSFDARPLVADVNHDGQPEIIAGTELGILYCLNSEGKLLWQHDCGGSIRAGAAAIDINMDGKPEILVGSANNKLTVLSGEGKRLFEHVTDAPVESVPGVMKSRSTNRVLIVFGNSKGILTAITPAENEVWKVNLKSKITAAPAFFSTKEEERLVIGTLEGNMVCVSEHGVLVWNYITEGSIYSAAAIADLNDDHSPEIVFGSCDNNIYALTVNGQRLWSFETDFWVTDTPIITDINGDSKPEVIAGSYDHCVYVLDGQGTYVLDYVPGLSGFVHQAGHYTSMMTSEPGQQTGKKLYQYKLDSVIVGCSLLERHDSKPTLVVNTKTGHVNTLVHES